MEYLAHGFAITGAVIAMIFGSVRAITAIMDWGETRQGMRNNYKLFANLTIAFVSIGLSASLILMAASTWRERDHCAPGTTYTKTRHDWQCIPTP